MNKRLVLFEPNEINGAQLYGIGLTCPIHPVTAFQGREKNEILNFLDLHETDAVMLVGGNAFKWLREFYHFGVRSENYADCSKLYRLSLEGGSFAKCCSKIPSPKEVQEFLDPNFTVPRDFSWFKYKILHTYTDSIRFLDWLDSCDPDTNFGFDYEASGMAWDKWFEISGAAICTKNYGGFISFTDLRHNSSTQEYQTILQRLGNFLKARMKNIWTYNMTYEFQVSHRMLGVDLYNLSDASVFNILDGEHMKKYSLKWTAQRILGVTVWDTEFDHISDLIDSMLYHVVGKLKAEKHKELKVSPSNFKNTEEWKELCQRYPSYVQEFESLILEYWGNEFMCIPSDILGKYCCLDSFYTLMIYEAKKTQYTQLAIDTFMDNLRLACRLHSCGINEDENFRNQYNIYSKKMMAWGITYCAEARCKIKMNKHSKKMANINKYNPISAKLLHKNIFFNGNTVEIAKTILSQHIDTMDTNDLGLNTGSLMLEYGEDFASDLEGMLRDAMRESEMIKTNKKTGQEYVKSKIDDGVIRKKKLLQIMGDKLITYLGIDKMKLGPKHEELEKYLYYERAYNELMKISRNQLGDIENIPEQIYAFGKNMDLLEYSTYLTKNLFYCTSPQENDEICLEFAQLYPSESVYLAALNESVQQLDGADKYYEKRGIKDIETAYLDFMKEWQKVDATGQSSQLYPDKMFTLAYQFYQNLGCDEVKQVWGDFSGYLAQEQFFKYVKDQYQDYSKPFEENDLNNNLFFMRKLVLNYLLFKKYAKVLSTYIDGLLAQDKWVIEDPKTHIIIREADPEEPGAVKKLLAHFQCMEKSSKRWSSGYHTLPSKSDIRNVVCSYPGCLLTYFDISSAEVKSAGFMAGRMAIEKYGENASTGLINTFNSGQDVYIKTAKIFLDEDGWNKLNDKDKKTWRKKFKTIFLGILYGLGKNSLAERLNCSTEDAENIIQTVYNAYPELDEYIKQQQNYPFSHEGKINTFFGDILVPKEWEYYNEATTQREKKNLEARIKRLGVNLPIQGQVRPFIEVIL